MGVVYKMYKVPFNPYLVVCYVRGEVIFPIYQTQTSLIILWTSLVVNVSIFNFKQLLWWSLLGYPVFCQWFDCQDTKVDGSMGEVSAVTDFSGVGGSSSCRLSLSLTDICCLTAAAGPAGSGLSQQYTGLISSLITHCFTDVSLYTINPCVKGWSSSQYNWITFLLFVYWIPICLGLSEWWI